MKSIGGECGVLSELMVLENHEFKQSMEELSRSFSLRRKGEKLW